MPVPRIAGKRGRTKPSHNERLLLKNFKPVAVKAPPEANVAGKASQFGMLGNDKYGLCGCCGVEHIRMLKAFLGVNADGSPNFPASFQVPTTKHTEQWYWDYGIAMGEPPPQPDQGVDNLSMFKWLYQKTQGVLPVGDDVIDWGFAELDVTDTNEVMMGMIEFKGVLLGACLTDEAEQEFANNQPWQVTPFEQPDPDMGHDFVLCAYTPQEWTVITWGALQQALIDFEKGEIAAGDLDAWVMVTREDAERTGTNIDALRAEIEAAIAADQGQQDIPTPKPVVVKPPTPEPVAPTPVSSPPPMAEAPEWEQLLQDVRDSFERLATTLREHL
jgi:hypothetical protein